MKRAAFLLVCLLGLANFQLSFANNHQDSADALQAHTFATPEETWNHFKSAIMDGDFETAFKCCCPDESRSVLKFEKMAPEKRKTIIESMGPIQKIVQQDKAAKYRLPRNSNGATFYTYVYFEKENAAWKIAGF